MTYPAKAVLFRQGDPADAIYYIVSGKVQITAVSKQGKEGVIALLGNGDFVGEGGLAGQSVYQAWATTAAISDVVKIPRHVMSQMIRENPQFAKRFTSFLLLRTLQIEGELIDHLFNSSEKRLARLLLLLANFGKAGKLEPIANISQELLAQRVGTTRSRISFFMNKFRRLGLIDYNGVITVNMKLINVIVDEQATGILKAELMQSPPDAVDANPVSG